MGEDSCSSQTAVGGSQSRLLLLTLWVCLGHKLSTEVVSSVKGREGQSSFSCSCPHIIIIQPLHHLINLPAQRNFVVANFLSEGLTRSAARHPLQESTRRRALKFHALTCIYLTSSN